VVGAVLAATWFSAGRARADLVTYQTVNDGLPPGPYVWIPDNIGWYWTPATDLMLDSIETRLTTGFTNINNNFTFTTELFTDRPAVGGTSLGSANWNGTAYNVDGWLGASFAAPISLTGGVTYFIGFSGWSQAFTGSGGAGVNWVETATHPTAQNLGAGSGYTGAGWMTQMWAGSTPANIDSPILRFVEYQEDLSPVPEPASAVLLALGAVMAGGFARRRQAAPQT
jgi:hypothetical protein